ncbi:MAG: hypothetical protein AAGI15_12880 [Pseudomonadota bacterium]
MIGTLNESPLHRAIKDHYRERLAQHGQGVAEEVPVGTFVADLRCGEHIVEVQTGHFGALRRKLATILNDHPVLVVHPIAVHRYLVRLSRDGDGTFTRRRSPKHGSRLNLLDELVSIPDLLEHPNFELEIALIEEETVTEYSSRARRGRGGWRTRERHLLDIKSTERLRCAADLWTWLEADLCEPFGTADLAAALGCSRELARKFAYCLRAAGAVEPVGKQGNAMLYVRSAIPA